MELWKEGMESLWDYYRSEARQGHDTRGDRQRFCEDILSEFLDREQDEGEQDSD